MSLKNQPSEIEVDGIFEITPAVEELGILPEVMFFASEDCSFNKDWLIRVLRGLNNRDLENRRNMKYKFYRIDE